MRASTKLTGIVIDENIPKALIKGCVDPMLAKKATAVVEEVMSNYLYAVFKVYSILLSRSFSMPFLCSEAYQVSKTTKTLFAEIPITINMTTMCIVANRVT